MFAISFLIVVSLLFFVRYLRGVGWVFIDIFLIIFWIVFVLVEKLIYVLLRKAKQVNFCFAVMIKTGCVMSV